MFNISEIGQRVSERNLNARLSHENSVALDLT